MSSSLNWQNMRNANAPRLGLFLPGVRGILELDQLALRHGQAVADAFGREFEHGLALHRQRHDFLEKHPAEVPRIGWRDLGAGDLGPQDLEKGIGLPVMADERPADVDPAGFARKGAEYEG